MDDKFYEKLGRAIAEEACFNDMVIDSLCEIEHQLGTVYVTNFSTKETIAITPMKTESIDD